MRRHNEGLGKLLGKPPDAFTAVGGREQVMALLLRFHAAGAHKFILRPIAAGSEEMLSQTKRLIEEVLSAVAAMN